MFWEKSFEELHTQIQENNDTSEISDASFVYLNQYLNELKKSDDVLESYESEIISQQLEYHNRLNDLSQEYKEKVWLLHQKNKNELLALFVQLENTEIPETKLHKIEWILENKIFEQSKNNLHDTLNIQWWIRWLLDSVIILNEDNNLFLNDLTLYFLDNNISISIDEEWNLEISNDELNSLLDTFTKANIQNPILPDSIELNTSNWLFTYKFENKKIYFKELYSDKKLEQSLLDSLSWEIPNQQIRLIDEKYWINIQWLSFIEKLNTYIDEWIYTHEDIIIFHENKNISTELLLKFLEQDENFNLLEYLENYPLPESIKDFSLNYVRNNLKLDDSVVSDEEILANIHTFIITFLHIESSWRNIANVAWVSSAKWYYQFLTDNGEKDEKWNRLGSSFQTAVKRTKRNLDDNKFAELFGDINLHKPTNADPRDLSAETQTLLFLNDIIENGKKINGNWVDEFMKLILKESNVWALWKIYKVLHHTNPDKATKEVFTKVKNNYFYWEWKLLAKNHY